MSRRCCICDRWTPRLVSNTNDGRFYCPEQDWGACNRAALNPNKRTEQAQHIEALQRLNLELLNTVRESAR